MAIGTNDYGLNRQNATNFGIAYAATLDDLHTALPLARIYCQTPIVRGTETANTFGNTTGDYRSQITTICDARSSWATSVDGSAFLTTSNLADGVHPNTAGHAIYALAVNNVLAVPPTVSFTSSVDTGPVVSDTISAGWGASATIKKWDYDSDGICSNNAIDYSKLNSDSMSQIDETNNTKFICLYGEDILGNKATLASDNSINIDSTTPTATISYDITTSTSGPVIATITPSESVTVTNNSGSLSHTFTTNGTFTFEFIDTAGNTGTATTTVSNINTTSKTYGSMPTIKINTLFQQNTTSHFSPFVFTKTLKQKSISIEVKELQKYLNSKGFTVSITGAGSLNNETNYFGLKTKQAVMKFQKANNLKQDGIVGPLTREQLNKIK